MEVKENQSLTRLFAGRLLLVAGKGGVGKTSCACALARRAVRAGRRVQLVEIRPGAAVPRLFGLQPSDDGPLEVAAGLSWQRLSPERALETYGMLKLRLRAVYNAVFEHRLVRRFLRAMPALSELLVLGHLAHLVEKEPDRLLVVDAPSTGPVRQMLEAPLAVQQASPPGALREAAEWIRRVLLGPETARLLTVVVPEELPVNEAIGLYHVFRDALGLAPSLVIANRLLGSPLSAAQAWLCRLATQRPEGRHLLPSLELVQARLDLQRQHLERLQAGSPIERLELPEVVGVASGRELVEALSGFLGRKVKEPLWLDG
jgi:hypothetical protein